MFTDLTGDRRSLRDDLHGAARDPTGPPPGAGADWTVPQNWEQFSEEEHAVWDLLFERQQRALSGRTVKAFQDGLDILRLSKPGIPEFAELNSHLAKRTGWRIVAVPGLLPDDVFFDHLRHRSFPAGNFIRTRAQLDYIEEPDVFHDVFGHVPMLSDPLMANWVQRLGDFGLEAMEDGTMPLLARLYWRTVEFGLGRENGELKILGAGIASSYGESAYSLESPLPARRSFDMAAVLSTPYRSDAFQDCYFVIDDLASLVHQTQSCSWCELLMVEQSQ